MLCARGYQGSARQVRRRVRALRPKRAVEAFLRRRVFVGEEAQVDWASFGKIQVGRAERALSCFVMTLSYSRRFYLEFFLDQTQESFLQGHVGAFEDLGGTPRVILYDNLRSAVLARHGSAVQFHPRLLELAAHYHYEPRACAPARGNEKGGVERTIRYIRDAFMAGRSACSIKRLNEDARTWRDRLADARRWPEDDRQTVSEAFTRERCALMALPQHPFVAEVQLPLRTRKTIYVRYDLNEYSIPPSAVGEALSLRATREQVRILQGPNVVATHRRSYDRHERVEDPTHVEALLASKQAARGSVCSPRLIDAAPETEALLAAAFAKGESVAQLTDRLLLLLDDYGASPLRAAIQEALAKDTPRHASIAYILARRRRSASRRPLPSVELRHRPDLQHLYVKPHDAQNYDQLAQPEPGDQQKGNSA
jgi:transposase